MKRPYTHAEWLRSLLNPVVLHTTRSVHNPYLEVALDNGRLVLNSQGANYSYGGLQRAFSDCFAEIGLGSRPVRQAALLWRRRRCPVTVQAAAECTCGWGRN
jgi:hypothetical protein